MTRRTRPLLHNGFPIEGKVTVKQMVERVFFTEVYQLSDNRYFYLFPDHAPGSVSKSIPRNQVMTISLGQAELPGVIVPEHTRERLLAIRSKMESARGLDCVAGMKELKAVLAREVIQPLRNPEKYEKFKLSLPNGILLYGPPGCGKTFMVKKLAEELDYFFIEVRHSSIGSPYIHQTAMKIAEVFEKARIHAPSIVFIDEIDGLLPRRDKLDSYQYKQEEVNEFLTHLNDSGKNNILVIGATNRPELLDPALLRAGRMDKHIYVSPPDEEARKELFRLFLDNRPRDSQIDFDTLARMTNGYACSDIELIVTEAARSAIDQNLPLIDQKILELEILKSVPSISAGEINRFSSFSDLER